MAKILKISNADLENLAKSAGDSLGIELTISVTGPRSIELCVIVNGAPKIVSNFVNKSEVRRALLAMMTVALLKQGLIQQQQQKYEVTA